MKEGPTFLSEEFAAWHAQDAVATAFGGVNLAPVPSEHVLRHEFNNDHGAKTLKALAAQEQHRSQAAQGAAQNTSK